MTLLSIIERIRKWDDIYQRDGKRYGENASIFCRLMLPYLQINKSNDILELGCGYGRDLLYLAQKMPNKHFIGVDASHRALLILQDEKRKQKDNQISYFEQDCFNLDIKGKFDCIFSHFFIHLFLKGEIKALFENMKHLLKNNGLLIISCISRQDNKFTKGTCLENNTYACYSDKPWHFLHFWDEREIRKVFSAYAFRIEFLCEYIEKERILDSIEETRSWFVVAQKI